MTDQISGLNIPSIQNKKQIAFKQNPVNIPNVQTAPAMQGVAMQGVTQDQLMKSVDNSYLSNRMKASTSESETDDLKKLGLGLGSWYLIAQGMDRFGPKCEGPYEKTILGRMGNWGDKFCKNTFVGRGLEKFFRWFNVTTYKLSKKSKIMYTLRNHSTKPEWQFARMPGEGVKGFLAGDMRQIFEEFLYPINKPRNVLGIPTGTTKLQIQRLEQYGNITQAEINAFADSLKGLPKPEKALKLQIKELELLGADPRIIQSTQMKPSLVQLLDNMRAAGISDDVITATQQKESLKSLQTLAEHLKLKKLGFKNKKEYQKLMKEILDRPKDVIKILEKAEAANPNLKASIWRGHGVWGKIKSHLIGRTASFSEYKNKYIAMSGKGHKTALGRAIPKAFAWLTEGCTNRFAGGKFAVAMQAFIFADMFLHTLKAPKGEKGKTLIERFVNDFTYFIALSAGVIGMHKIGGFKYAGLDAKGREAYRKALEKFNKKVDAGAFKSKKAHNMARKALDAKLGAKNIKNPITKLLHKIGKFINIGNERVHSYKSVSKWNLNWLRKLGNGNIIGVPLRIIIPMAIISPFLAKWATKGVHAIFGRPTKSVLDEETEETQEQTQGAQPPVNQTPINDQSKVNGVSQGNDVKNNSPRNPQDYADSNLIKQRINGQNVDHTQTVPERTYVPSPESMVKQTPPPLNDPNKKYEPERTYIPSPIGMIPQSPDATAANQALARADLAEKMINETLNSL